MRRQNWKTWAIRQWLLPSIYGENISGLTPRACLRQGGLTKSLADARRLLRWCKREHKTKMGIVDARREALGQTLDARETESVLEALTKGAWLKKKTIPTSGRSRHRWEVNPALHEPEN